MQQRTLAALFFLFAFGASASAQPADVRDVRPVVMLLMDSSASMNFEDESRDMPDCSGMSPERNRWAHTLEALTGTWGTNFACSVEERSGAAWCSGAPDCSSPVPFVTHPGTTGQAPDGVLDSYASRVKFGLMTFDSIMSVVNTGTSVDRGMLEMSLWTSSVETRSNGADGGYSFGSPQELTFPGCGSPRMVNLGSANESAAGGALISVGSDAASDFTSINTNIQDTLLAARPYGGTPTAALLSDFEAYLDSHPDVAPIRVAAGAGDAYASCRPRYAILFTDGASNMDFRDPRIGCGTGGTTCPYDRLEETATRLCAYNGSRCTGDLAGLYVIGYDVDSSAAAELNLLADAGGTCADPSGNCAYLIDSSAVADPTAAIREVFARILDGAAPGTTTRTAPALAATGVSSSIQGQIQLNSGFRLPENDGEPWSGVLERRRFICDGLDLQEQPVEAVDRFHDILDARGTARRILTVVPNNVSNAGGHLVGDNVGLPSMSPASTGSGRGNRGGGNKGNKGQGGSQCRGTTGGGSGGGGGGRGGGRGGGGGGGGGASTSTGADEEGLTLEAFSQGNANISRQLLGVSTAAERSAVIDFVVGDSSTRPHRLGDIYHSSPVVLGPPDLSLADESYNEFRQDPEVANRPRVMFVGANDGMLHAFAVEDTTITQGEHNGETYTAGEELWAFIPPIMLPRLDSSRTAHQFMVDGTPLLQDVFFRKTPGQIHAAGDEEGYHSILIFGLRGGGNAYLALDVTDPLEPEFLWQVSADTMGATYGTPAVAQVLVRVNGTLEERAIALLPGGAGNDLATTSCGGVAVPMEDGYMSKPIGCPSRGVGRPPVNEGTLNARENQRCWDETGRTISFVDPATGELVTLFDDDVFNAPMVGGVSFFPGEPGTVSTRAFMTDQDGVIWRFDVSNPDITEWTALPFHDMFHDRTATEGQPAFEAPILSADPEGGVVVIQGTGNTDDLEALRDNRVVSLTETLEYDTAGNLQNVGARLNWEITSEISEQVTGRMELFDGTVYFSTFRSSTSATDSCEFGYSRIWGVDYIESDGTNENGTPAPVAAILDDAGTEVMSLPPMSNQLVMGVAIAQQPSCTIFDDVTVNDPYIGSRAYTQAAASSPGGFRLVAQVSGDGVAAEGGTVAEFSRELPTPASVTRIQGWAGNVRD